MASFPRASLFDLTMEHNSVKGNSALYVDNKASSKILLLRVILNLLGVAQRAIRLIETAALAARIQAPPVLFPNS